MKHNKGKNGLSINEDIELTEVGVSQNSVITYLIQALLLVVLSLSILYCFFTGMQIEVNIVGLYVVVIILVAYFLTIFSVKAYLKVSLPFTVLLYLLVGFIFRDNIYSGFAELANAVIKLCNAYFNSNILALYYENVGESNLFVFYAAVLLVGFLCYIVVYGKNILSYLLVTIPLALSPLVVGYVPSYLPYMGYIAGTVGIFGCVASEKYGRTGHKVKTKEKFNRVDTSKVAIQGLCMAAVCLLAVLVYAVYSPAKYEKEFNAVAIRETVNQKVNDVLSGDLFKGTFLEGIFHKGSASGGLNKGDLNTAGEIKFNHETALKVTTIWAGSNHPCYLRGYVGEQYNSKSWNRLTGEDQDRLDKLQDSFTLAKNGESIESAMMNLLGDSQYQVNPYNEKTMEVENVAANKSVSYIPYNTVKNITNDKGSLQTSDNKYTYYDFNPVTQMGSPLSEIYRRIDFMNVLKLNMINSRIYEDYFNVKMNADWTYGVKKSEVLASTLYGLGTNELGDYQSQLEIPIESVYSGEDSSPESLPLYVNQTTFVVNMGESIATFNEYAKEENAYFSFVRDAYTRLPDGLDKVKKLVAGHEVNAGGVDLNGEDYTDLKELGGIDSVLEAYNKKVSLTANGNNLEDVDSIQNRYYEAIEFVRNYLAKNTAYTLKPGKTPSNEDFVEYFLFENKKGYCVHYATAATVMLRAMGVPARYVEGYVITSDDYRQARELGDTRFESVDTDGNAISLVGRSVEINVEDANAHAWTEVYLPGLGWQPIEMTAPYIYGSTIEIPKVNTDPKATLRPTPSMAPTTTPSATPRPTLNPTKKPAPKATPKTTPKANTGSSSTGFLQGIKNWYNGLDKWIQRLITTTIFLLICCILSVVVIYGRYVYVVHDRGKKRRTFNNREWVLYEYQQVTKILSRFKLDYITSQPFEEFAKTLTETFPFVEEQQAIAYYTILLKARFTEDSIADSDVQVCERFYDTFVNGLYDEAKKAKKWVYRRIWII